MKLNLIVLFLFLTVGLRAQTNVKIILTANQQVDSVQMSDVSSKEFYTLKYSDTLNFHFKKSSIDWYHITYLTNGKPHRVQAWLNPGDPIIKCHTVPNNLVIDTVINSPIYYEAKKYQAANPPVSEKNEYLLDQIKKNIDNSFSLLIAMGYINSYQNSRTDLLKLKSLLDTQGTKFSWSILYNMSVERLNSLLKIDHIDLANFQFINRKHQTVSGITNDAKYYVLDFWFVGCVPCMQQHKTIKSEYLKLAGKQIAVIGISTDLDFIKWEKYLKDHKYAWDNYLQTGSQTLTKHLSVNEAPLYIVINKNGDVKGTYGSFDEVLKNSDKFN